MYSYTAGRGSRLLHLPLEAVDPFFQTPANRENAMPFVPAPGVASLDVIWEQQNQLVENTFHYHKGTAWDEASLTALCNTYFGGALTLLAGISSNTSLVKAYARDLSSSTGPSVEVNPPEAIDGANTSGVLPNNVTFALKRLTGLAGRKNRGRIFLIGLPLNQLTPDRQQVLGPQAANYAALYDGIMSAQLADNGATEVLLHKADGTFTPVIGYGWSDTFVDSQRRRLAGHNRHR